MKKSTSTVLAAAMLFGCASTIATAQTTGPNRKSFGTGELPEFLKAYDLNGDGKLSVEERQAYEKATREARPPRPGMKNPWDTDGDGVLSETEKQAARDAIAAKMLAERTKRFTELDKNIDTFLDATELLAIPRITQDQVNSMITHLDKDADGKISKDEFLAAMAPVEPPLLRCPLPRPLPTSPIPSNPLLKAFDTNNDRWLSPAELAAALAVLDTTADGVVSEEEWKTYLLAHPELLVRDGDGSGGSGGSGGPGGPGTQP